MCPQELVIGVILFCLFYFMQYKCVLYNNEKKFSSASKNNSGIYAQILFKYLLQETLVFL